jgi:threonine aldolase
LDLTQIETAIRAQDAHQPITRLVAIENTHNRCGGKVLTEAYTHKVSELAHRHNLKLHIDGARIFNAAVALGVPARALAAPADSITFCLSKALCAPVGSVVCGSKVFIQQAHRVRKMLGGGMRQAGILAAAGIIALETMIERLAEDHVRAKNLAQGLSQLPGIELDPGTPHTNMIFCGLSQDVALDAAQAKRRLEEKGVKVGQVDARRFRLVTHYWIDDSAVERATAAFADILKSG